MKGSMMGAVAERPAIAAIPASFGLLGGLGAGAKNPCLGGIDVVKVCDVPAVRRALDLRPRKRGSGHDCDTARVDARGVKGLLESRNGILGLDRDLANVDKGQVFVRSATQLLVGSVSISDEPRNVFRLEKAGYPYAH